MRIVAWWIGLVLLAGCGGQPAAEGPRAMPVVAAEVIVRDQPIYFEALGQTIGAQDVEIRARVEGILEEVHFREGAMVEKGDLLYSIDPSTVEANLAQARGNLAQAEAALDKARRDVQRLTPLWEKNAISRQMLDDALAAEQAGEGAVETARGAVDNMQIQLGYTKIYAPITGLIGKTEVKAGNLVGRGQNTLLTTLSALDPIAVRFSISEQDFLALQRANSGNMREQAAAAVFSLILADGQELPAKGQVMFADRNVDPATGTLLVEVSFPNPDYRLRPGQFARVRAPVEEIQGAILVPQRAVRELQATYSVFGVGADDRAERRPVKVGARVDNLYVIAEGLQPGEQVVVEGWQKLQNGTPVSMIHPAAE